MTLVILLLALASPFVLMALFVDDWSRDLTTNTANTDPAAADETMRPWTIDSDADRIDAAIARLVADSAPWSTADESPLPEDSPLPAMAEGDTLATRHLVRTTGLMGYRDDVWLVVEDAGAEGVRLHGESRSRVGKGDLGQNPRNLRELRSLLEAALSQPNP